jgi:hypothetical protein
MPFKKGESGNPGGRPKELAWRNALQMAITAKTGKPLAEALAEIANGLVDLALAGNLTAIREIADRVDGKPSAQVSLNHGLDDSFAGSGAAIEDVTELLLGLLKKTDEEN